jgi:hypothetical protein
MVTVEIVDDKNGITKYIYPEHPGWELYKGYDVFAYPLPRFEFRMKWKEKIGRTQNETVIPDDEIYKRIFLPLKTFIESEVTKK